MATQAKHLAMEKGILPTPNPKVAKGYSCISAELLLQGRCQQNDAREEDCVTLLENGEKKKIQKRRAWESERGLPAV